MRDLEHFEGSFLIILQIQITKIFITLFEFISIMKELKFESNSLI